MKVIYLRVEDEVADKLATVAKMQKRSVNRQGELELEYALGRYKFAPTIRHT